jgi:hypothetical protein
MDKRTATPDAIRTMPLAGDKEQVWLTTVAPDGGAKDRLTDGGKFVSLTRRSVYFPETCFFSF